MAKGVTKKEELYNLFAQGCDWRDEEAKKIAKKSGTRETYWYEWDKAGRPGYIGHDIESKSGSIPPPTPEHSEELPKGKAESGKPSPTVSITDASFRVSPKQGLISIGHISIPYEDWGYSSIAHMLVVASTYQEVSKPKSEGGYGYTGPVGDFCADCVKLFRRIFDFDKIREEEIMEEAD